MKKYPRKSGFNLKAYSALAVFGLGANSAFSQIVYTDFDPDEIIEGDFASHIFDLNDDGIDDFAVYRFAVSSGFADFVIPMLSASIAASMPSGFSSYVMAFAMEAGDDIGDAAGWPPGSLIMLASQSAFFPGENGNWLEAADQYMGVRLDMGDHYLYGWLRMDIGEDGTPITIKDMAYNSTPDEHICAGDMFGASDCLNAVSATVITVVSDTADNENGLDLVCTFNPVSAEDEIDAYHVIAVKADAAAAFTIATAAALGADRYVPVTPAGLGTYTVSFTATSKDSEGDAIVNDQPYRVFVLSVAAGIYDHALSEASAEIILTTEEDTAILVKELDQLISVYPNPVHGSEMLTAEIMNIPAGEVIFEITDITGNKTNNAFFISDNTVQSDVSALPAGVYLLKSTFKNAVHVVQFVKN